MTLGFLALSLSLFLFGFNSSQSCLWLFFAIYGFSVAITDSVSKAFVADIAKQERKGESFGLYYVVIGFLTILGNITFGFLWDEVNHTLPFLVAGILVAFGSFLLLFLFRDHKHLPQDYDVRHFKAYRS